MVEGVHRFGNPDVSAAQRATCDRIGVPYVATRPDLRVGINLDGEPFPVNGMREPLDPEFDELGGWWIWNGERVKTQADFSAIDWNSLHAAHLLDYCPEVVPYLGLPPGWRFLIAPDYEDVWEDPTLLLPG